MSDKSATLPEAATSLKFEDAIAAYLEHLQMRNYSPQTVQSQTKQLRIFQRFCAAARIHNPDQVTRKLIVEFQAYLHRYQKRRGGGLAASTQRQWLSAVISFFAWLSRRGAVPVNPAADLEMPRTEFRLFQIRTQPLGSETEPSWRSSIPPAFVAMSCAGLI